MSVKLLDIVVIAFKYYSNTYCLLQCSCFVCSSFPHTHKKQIRITTFKAFTGAFSLRVIHFLQ